MKKTLISLVVNGDEYEAAVGPTETLLSVLRNHLELTGAKEGCGEGACGSCTVLMDGHPVRSCLTLALEADGAEIETIEGQAQGGQLNPIQQAFIDHGAIQCGFCTPGMIMTATAFLRDNPSPSPEETAAAISGNFCRCTGYTKIVEAILAAAEEMKSQA